MDSVRGATAAKQLNPIDRHIGRQLRLARKLHGISQQELAERLRVTFQQLQQYEKGVNRVTASRLHHAALVFDVPISFFFPTNNPAPQPSAGEGASRWETVIDFSKSPEAADLIISFSQISDTALRHRVLELVRILASRIEAQSSNALR